MTTGSNRDSETAATALPLGVWRRGPSDWAYRVEVEGYGSIYGCGFESRDEARARMEQVRREAEEAVDVRDA